MTPIELEDIVSMAKGLDDVVDSIDDITQHAYMYDLKKVLPEMQEFSALILKCCSVLISALNEFKNFKKSKSLHKYLIEVNTIESQGDKLYATSVRTQFTTNTDNRQLLINMNMLDLFEVSLDTCEDVASIMESVVMKNT
jgi:uncharacterized protein Yka (UPF0111/DUF47 family)